MATAWTEAEAAHLLGRAGFEALQSDVDAAVKLGREETVNRLLAGKSLTDQEDKIAPIEEVKADGKPLNADKINDQETYWLYRMTVTQAPLIEKMALFWHGHFATSFQKVKSIPMMLKQIELFRTKGLGSFHELVTAVSDDPAMMVWLDANSNRKGAPNENYAREVMELFTLGIGNYTESDIKEAARAFTGWSVNKDTMAVKFNPKAHDDGVKTVLGETGKFDEQGVINVLFDQKALPQFMAGKLLMYFAAPNPSADWVDQVASDFAAEPTVADVLRKLFLSDAFYAPENRLALIKTPAEYVAGIVKALKLPLSGGYAQAMRKMGMELYLPPDVAGWRGGATWLMSTNLLSRYQFAESVAKRANGALLTSAAFTPADKSDAQAWVKLWAEQVGIGPLGDSTLKAAAQYADEAFLHTTQRNNGMRGLLQLLLISPEAQMK